MATITIENIDPSSYIGTYSPYMVTEASTMALKSEIEPIGVITKDHDLNVVKETCKAFTRLLLKQTPFKAKEFVERNCAVVTEKIIDTLMDKL